MWWVHILGTSCDTSLSRFKLNFSTILVLIVSNLLSCSKKLKLFQGGCCVDTAEPPSLPRRPKLESGRLHNSLPYNFFCMSRTRPRRPTFFAFPKTQICGRDRARSETRADVPYPPSTAAVPYEAVGSHERIIVFCLNTKSNLTITSWLYNRIVGPRVATRLRIVRRVECCLCRLKPLTK